MDRSLGDEMKRPQTNKNEKKMILTGVKDTSIAMKKKLKELFSNLGTLDVGPL